ncbi:PREDICTED: mitochondrial carrier protein MTM1-like isoform X2 [Populus euphratica]|uniref:Mitochondrial carrier protein MTM1-like isoform X2 n=1 Tax=Populus euphratica TaxID=75702 RepID=A0AAJ6X1H4_POPEU|nr:PREDICTED: mitochondrial carrier protein MTM1-like isoform X2 [Populus euphratica]
MMGSGITRNQWEINNDSKGHDLSSMMVLHGSHDHGGLAERGFCDAQVQRQSNGAAAAATTATDWNLGIGERVLSAAGAAFLSAIIVNPLDVVKTRLQAQAAGVAYSHPLSNIISRMAYFGPTMMFADLRCSPSCTRAGIHGTVLICPPDCFQYKGTLDVFYKIIRQWKNLHLRCNSYKFVIVFGEAVAVFYGLKHYQLCNWRMNLQEGFARLWRGTNAGLALAVPTVGIYLPCYDLFRNWLEDLTAQNIPGATPYVPLVAGSLARSLACATCYPIELARTRMQAFKATQTGKPPGVWKTLLEVLSHVRSTNNVQNTRGYRFLWTGMGAQLARDVPYSAICWSTLEPIRRRLLSLVGEESNGLSVFGANFSASFVAGSLAAAATCPLDVAKTRRQIEDPVRALRMTTRQTLMEVWRDGGIRALFTGVGPRVGRAGPSVGIVVSFYEVVKYALHHRYATSE